MDLPSVRVVLLCMAIAATLSGCGDGNSEKSDTTQTTAWGPLVTATGADSQGPTEVMKELNALYEKLVKQCGGNSSSDPSDLDAQAIFCSGLVVSVISSERNASQKFVSDKHKQLGRVSASFLRKDTLMQSKFVGGASTYPFYTNPGNTSFVTGMILANSMLTNHYLGGGACDVSSDHKWFCGLNLKDEWVKAGVVGGPIPKDACPVTRDSPVGLADRIEKEAWGPKVDSWSLDVGAVCTAEFGKWTKCNPGVTNASGAPVHSWHDLDYTAYNSNIAPGGYCAASSYGLVPPRKFNDVLLPTLTGNWDARNPNLPAVYAEAEVVLLEWSQFQKSSDVPVKAFFFVGDAPGINPESETAAKRNAAAWAKELGLPQFPYCELSLKGLQPSSAPGSAVKRCWFQPASTNAIVL